ncbi:MAG TPA: cold-shock protein [Actinomycetota bacterium]
MSQGTIKSYDEQSKSGVILDDGATEIAFDHESFRTSGIRLFRIGQRVKFDQIGEGSTLRVSNLTIVTL